MKKTKKNLILSVCAGALSLLCATGVVAVKANADVTEDNGKVSVSSFTMIKTASAYIGDVNGSDVTGGLRFDATLSKDDYDALAKNYNAVKFGMLVAPTDFIATNVETDLVVGSTSLPEYVAGATYTVADKGMVNQEITPTYNTEDYPNLYAVRCAITNIKEYNFSRPFTARAYIATQKEANGAWEYTYDDSCQRAIYSIATYAINDGLTFSEDASKQRAVESYLNGIIDTVQQYYDISVTQTVNDGTTTEAKIGDTITLNGVATKIDDATKTLDMCPTVTVTENSAMTVVADTQGRKYKVTGLGNVAYTWTSGAEGATNTENGTSQINGQTKLTVLDGADTLSNLAVRSKAQIVPVDETHEGYSQYVQVKNGSYQLTTKDHAVFAWSLKEGVTPDKSEANLVGFSFVSDIIKYMKKDIYVYMDIVIPGNSSTADTAYGLPYVGYATSDNLTTLLYSKVGSDYHQYYSKDGTNLGSGTTDAYNVSWSTTRVNTWLRLGFPLRADWDNASWTMISHYLTGGSFKGTVYLSNMFLSSENLEDSDGNITPVAETTVVSPNVQNFATPATVFTKASSTKATFSSLVVEDGDTATATIVGDRTDVYQYTTASGTDYGGHRLYLNKTYNTMLNAYRYLTFDVYFVSGDCYNGFNVDVGSTNETKYFHNGKQYTATDYVMSCYNISGATPTLSKSSKGKWFTIEIWYRSTATLNYNTSGYSQYFSIGSGNCVAYISNVRMSTYSLMGTTV